MQDDTTELPGAGPVHKLFGICVEISNILICEWMWDKNTVFGTRLDDMEMEKKQAWIIIKIKKYKYLKNQQISDLES